MMRARFLYGVLLTTVLILPAKGQERQACNLNRFSTLPITTMMDGRFTVPAMVNEKKLNFLVDTGGVTATVERDQAFNLQLPSRSTGRELRGVGGNALNTYTIIKSFSLDRREMIVGVSILRRLHLYIAYGEQKLYLTPATAQ